MVGKQHKVLFLIVSIILLSFGAHGSVKKDKIFYIQKFDTPAFIKVLDHGHSSFAHRIKLIRSAQKTIDIEYFIFRDDFSGKVFLSELIEASKRGVRVRILLDYFMTSSTFTEFLSKELKKFNIQTKYFNKIHIPSFYRAQFRNHRKSVIVDRRTTIFGGRNIGDEYFDLSPVFNFLDRDVIITGEVSETNQKHFNRYWNSRYSNKIKDPKVPNKNHIGKYKGIKKGRYIAKLKAYKAKTKDAKDFLEGTVRTREYVDNLLSYSHSPSEKLHLCQTPTIVSDPPKRRKHKRRFLRDIIYDSMKKAKESIWIDSPYFIVDKKNTLAIKNSLRKGVNVNLITNSLNSTDAIYISSVFYDTISYWIERGMNTYLYKGHVPLNYPLEYPLAADATWGTHSKTYLFDDDKAIIGTYNFDPRSQNYNMEHALVCEDSPELVSELKSRFIEKTMNTHPMESFEDIVEEAWVGVSRKKTLIYYLLKIPAYIFKGLL